MSAPRLGDCGGEDVAEALEHKAALEALSEQHLCSRCVHNRICAVAKAIENTVGLGLVVSACPEYFGLDELEAGEP